MLTTRSMLVHTLIARLRTRREAQSISSVMNLVCKSLVAIFSYALFLPLNALAANEAFSVGTSAIESGGTVTFLVTATTDCKITASFGDGKSVAVKSKKNRQIPIEHTYENHGRYTATFLGDQKRCSGSHTVTVSLGNCFESPIEANSLEQCLGFTVFRLIERFGQGMLIASHDDIYSGDKQSDVARTIDAKSFLSSVDVSGIVDKQVRATDPRSPKGRIIAATTTWPSMQSPDYVLGYLYRQRSNDQPLPELIAIQNSAVNSVTPFLKGSFVINYRNGPVNEKYAYEPLFRISHMDVLEELKKKQIFETTFSEALSEKPDKLIILEDPSTLPSMYRRGNPVFTYCSSLKLMRSKRAAQGVFGGRRNWYLNESIHSSQYQKRSNSGLYEIRVRFVDDAIQALNVSRDTLGKIGANTEDMSEEDGEKICDVYIEVPATALQVLTAIAEKKTQALALENVRVINEGQLLNLYAESEGCAPIARAINCDRTVFRDYAHYEFVFDKLKLGGIGIARLNKHKIYDQATLELAFEEMKNSKFSDDGELKTLFEYLDYKEYAKSNGYDNALIARQAESDSKKRQKAIAEMRSQFERYQFTQLGLSAKGMRELGRELTDVTACLGAAALYKPSSPKEISISDALYHVFDSIAKIYSAFRHQLDAAGQKIVQATGNEAWRAYQQEAGFGSQEYYLRQLLGRCDALRRRHCALARTREVAGLFPNQVDAVAQSCASYVVKTTR
jgi:hypothetical protein